jgi:hypothetical protein
VDKSRRQEKPTGKTSIRFVCPLTFILGPNHTCIFNNHNKTSNNNNNSNNHNHNKTSARKSNTFPRGALAFLSNQHKENGVTAATTLPGVDINIDIDPGAFVSLRAILANSKALHLFLQYLKETEYSDENLIFLSSSREVQNAYDL